MDIDKSKLTIDYRTTSLDEKDWYAMMKLLKDNDYRAILECISCFARCNAELDPANPDMREDVLIRGGLESMLNVLYGQGQTYEFSGEYKLYPFTWETEEQVQASINLMVSEYEAAAAKAKPPKD
jgi:hypothetical protein